MGAFMNCRRFATALVGIVALTFLGWYRSTDVSLSIASICIGLASANAYERSATSKNLVQYGGKV
jgi:hypothetical protein